MKHATRKSLSLLLAVVTALGPFGSMLSAQTTQEDSVEKPPTRPAAIALLDGTPVRLLLNRTISSKDAKTGDNVDFEVIEDVKVGELVVVPKGSIALATVTRAKPKGRMAKGGKLDIRIDYVRLVSGEKVPLRAVKETKGGNYTGTMTGAIVASGILFFPAAPFFLFMKGKDIKIERGTAITAYVSGDVALDAEKFSSPVETLSVSVKSTPEGAEIEIDGQFVGSTPSTVPLRFGARKIVVKKAGYNVWERSIAVATGSAITIDAVLEKLPQ